jgi:hypothetical protein
MSSELTHKCSTCHEIKPHTADNFSRDHRLPNGLARRCRVCARRVSLAWSLSPAGRASKLRYLRSDRGQEMARLFRAKIKQQQAERKLTNV